MSDPTQLTRQAYDAMYNRDFALLRQLLVDGACPHVPVIGPSILERAALALDLEVLEILFRQGADPVQVKWNAVHLAVVVGTAEDLNHALSTPWPLESEDMWGRTAIILACEVADTQKLDLLVEAGANLGHGARLLRAAQTAKNLSFLNHVLAYGPDPLDDSPESRFSPLDQAAGLDWAEGLERMLEVLPLPARGPEQLSHALRCCKGGRCARILLDAGGQPQHGLSYEAREHLRRMGKPPPRSLDIVPAEEYQRNKHGRFGTTNPTRDTSLFRQVMLETDATPYGAKEHFGESDYTSPGENEVWWACRLGQSTTALPDGRLIEIGGEHEDSYDPDFCIYNDVIVHQPDGTADIFGYPESVFPPTDFHSATLVGDWIYILGRLGYAKGRVPGRCPIFRLSLTDYHMEELRAGGDDPGFIHGHIAALIDGSRIRVTSGKAIIRNPQRGRLQPFMTVPLNGDFELDLSSLLWRRL